MKSSTLVLIALLLGGCTRYYNGDIAGYIKDSATSNGINGAVVRMYLTEPATADAGGFIVETASMTSGGNNGYYSHKIIWETTTPTFGEEGDSGTVWVSVSHEDYIPAIREVSGVLSGTLNVVPDMLLDTVAFVTPEVTGTVILNGQATNGVRVVLRVPAEVEGEDPDEYVAITQTVDEQEGTYEFTDVSWRDQEPEGEEYDTQEVQVYIDDNNYISDYSEETPLAVTLTSDQRLDIETDIDIMRVTYTAPVVTGKVRNTNGDGVNGVQVVLDIISTEDEEDYVVTSGTWDGEPGTYRFVNVAWRDEEPDSPDSDLEAASIWVDDPDYTGDYNVDAPLGTTVSSEQETDVPTDLIVTRNTRYDFTVTVQGRIFDRYVLADGTIDIGIPGEEIRATWTDANGDHELADVTEANGGYSFFLQWTRSEGYDQETQFPGDYEQIPGGEDMIVVHLDYMNATFTDFDHTAKSWMNPNHLPDVIVEHP